MWGVERKYVSSSSCNKGHCCATMHVNVHDSEDTLLVNHDEQSMRGLGLIIQDIPKRGNLSGVEKVEGCYLIERAKKSNNGFHKHFYTNLRHCLNFILMFEDIVGCVIRVMLCTSRHC